MDELNKLSPAGWKILNASRLNPDADLDYQEILELEVLARCGGQTDRELDVILRKIGAVYDDPSAAVKAIRSGEISFEQIGGHWFVLVPGGTADTARYRNQGNAGVAGKERRDL